MKYNYDSKKFIVVHMYWQYYIFNFDMQGLLAKGGRNLHKKTLGSSAYPSKNW